jgi:hypothetical protein
MDEIALLKRAVDRVGSEATFAGERDAMRAQTDFIGRMNDAFAEIHQAYDDESEAFPEGDDREDAIDALISLAGLCIGLVAMLRTPEPEQP